ncbi:MAG: aminotransferase class I/II-fold pyridoxal phosphate-dependent enzyme [Desulfobacterales bacterium]|nr:aminotransferase class I/II-fold pyridoxal phosphate-dependent enzyme [Desulfobacterales bacterium]
MTQNKPDYLDATYDMFISSISGERSESVRFHEWVKDVEEDDAFAFEALRLGAQTTEVEMRRTTGSMMRVINMSSYNYLGYGCHPEVIAAAKEALDRYGLGACSSPVHSGTFKVHAELEKELVDFVGLEGRGATLFSSGYGVNTGVVTALMKKRHHIVMDRSAHMSILEGAQLSRAKLSYFNHNDPDDLRDLLKGIAGKAKRILVCTEGVFSADGDFGELKGIVEAAKEYGAMVLVDEAHSFLVAGPNGRGVCEAAGVLEDVDLFVTTFSKSLGGVGGALIADKAITRYVNWYAKCRMFSCAIDPAVTGGVLKGLQLGRGTDGDRRRERILENVGHLRSRLQARVDLGVSESWIVTVTYGEEELTIPLLDFMQRNGVDVSMMQFPAVPVGESRIRLFVTSEHTKEQLDKVAEVVLRAAEKYKFTIR